MTQYWARQELVEAVQWSDDNVDEVESLIGPDRVQTLAFGYATDPDVVAEIRTSREGWKGIHNGDYVYTDGLGEICVLSRRDFIYRYYRRVP